MRRRSDKGPFSVETIIDIAATVGFRLADTLSLPLARRYGAHQSGQVASEPMFVFEKP